MKFFKSSFIFLLTIILSTSTFAKEKVIFWYSLSGQLQKSLINMVDSYNASQDKIEIEAIFQGSYEESIAKFKAVSGTKEAPAIVQMNDISTAFMYKSGAITPIEKFIKEDNFNIDNLEDVLLNYYRINGELYSMPFNSSSAILVYNKEAFKKAGLNPENPPKNYSDILKYSEKLTLKDDKGITKQFGFSMIMYGWFIEQLLANENNLYVNENNGRDGKSPTKVAYEKELPNILSWLRDIYSNGYGTSYGREWSSTRTAFSSGKVAMYLDSSAGLRGVINNAKFEVGTGFIPNKSGEFNGSIIGGASLWITNSVNETNQKAAWDFIKYTTSKDVQSTWAINTGYYPVNKLSYSTKEMIDNMNKFPQFKTAIEEIQATKENSQTQGAILGVFPEVREKMVQAMENNYEGKGSVENITKRVAKESNRIIKRFNRINK